MENLVVSIFKTESEAYQAFAELKTFKQTEKTKVAQIAVIKNEGGHITDKDRFDFEDSANDGALKGGLIGAFVGLLAGPLGVLFGYGIGSLYGLAGGDTVEAVQEGLIDQVSQKLVSGETALVALVQEDDEQVLNAYFNKYDTQILRWNVESVVEEIEAAAKVQADLYNKARAQMKAERKEARKEKIEYAINRFTMEAKRQLDLLDQELAKRPYIAGDEYTIADIAIWSWYGQLVKDKLYQNSAEFLDAQSYKHLNEWADRIAQRPAVQKGVKAEYKSIK